jgi:hypothetical protein
MQKILVAVAMAIVPLGTAHAKQAADFNVPVSIVKRAVADCYDALGTVDIGIRWDDCVMGQIARWHKTGKYPKLTIAE